MLILKILQPVSTASNSAGHRKWHFNYNCGNRGKLNSVRYTRYVTLK